MKIPALSVDLAVHRGFLSHYDSYKVKLGDLTSRSACQYSNSISRYPLAAPVFGDYLMHLQVKSKENRKKYPQVFAKLQGNDDLERNNWNTYKDMLDAVTQKPGSHLSSETSHAGASDLVSSEEDSDCQTIRQELSQHSFDNQVYLDKLRAVLLHVLASEQWNASHLKMCHGCYMVSAMNLIHYLALHCLDVQQLKEELSSIGLLNLECTTSYVLASITAGIQLLQNLAPNSQNREQNSAWNTSMRDYVTSQEGEKATEFSISAMRKRASMHAKTLLGSFQDEKDVHIMVTVGKEAITNKLLLNDLLKAGANIIRINCAHDEPSVWSEIIRLAKHSSQMLEKPCRILMDLAGQKLRTGLLKTGPNVMKISPQKNAKGDVVFPAQVWLSCSGCGPPSHLSQDAVLFVDSERFLNQVEVGNVLRFVDVRGRKRSLKISKKYSVFNGYGYMADCSKTSYLGSGTRLHIERKKGRDVMGQIINVPAAEQFIRLRVGDLLAITRDPSLSMNESYDNSGLTPRITCDSGRLFDSVKPGDPIAFDDGKIWGVIQGVSINEVVVSITHASPKGSKLGSEKSINIPKSHIQFEGLTSKDLMDLEFVAANADMVGISFIRDARDMVVVFQELEKRKLHGLGVVLKIETRGAFEKLPLLLLQAMQFPNPLGVMIARGDLAVECGWDEMATIQEEILSICRAAHIPVIWATQVLESLVKNGIPTRAEITDVASGMRANCIMLNKGKYIVEAVASLDSILHGHSTKKNMKTLMKPLFPSS